MNGFIDEILTVSEITGEIKSVIEREFDGVTVIGELSNFKDHFSGHWYFTLKDKNASINCTMWKSVNKSVYFSPQDGMKIIVKGRITLYAPRGSYQIDVRSMKPAGQGELQLAYEKLKEKLNAEGLFDESVKKPIPAFPEKIGIATAIGGAALRDMISVAERRYPNVKLIVGGCRVQGEGAAEEIAARIKEFNEIGEADVLIVGRGGGSLEDLWAFNEEIVARAIFNSHIPVISGVGHEIDFTIADFVADLRAPTPTAAMELATPDKDELINFLNDFQTSASYKINSKIERYKNQVSDLIASYGFRTLFDKLASARQTLDYAVFRLSGAIDNIIKDNRNKLDVLEKSLSAADFNSILKRGFALIVQNKNYVDRLKKLDENVSFEIDFYDGKVKVNK